jgi:hypothetical protein
MFVYIAFSRVAAATQLLLLWLHFWRENSKLVLLLRQTSLFYVHMVFVAVLKMSCYHRTMMDFSTV